MKRLLTLCLTIILSMSLAINVSAEQSTIPVNASISGVFEVLLPINIEMGNEVIEVPYYVQADLPGNHSLLVTMRNSIELTDDLANQAIAYVANSKSKYSYSEILTKVQETFKVSTQSVTAGKWTGNVDVVVAVTEDVTDGAGLYDSSGNMLADWNTLVNSYGLDVETDYSLTFPEGHISKVLTKFTDPAKLVIPGTVGRLGQCSIYGVTLDTVELLEGVSTVGVGAFIDSTINNLIFPTSLTEIEGAAFQKGTYGVITIPNTLVNFGEGNLYHTTYDAVTVDGVNPYYSIVDGVLYDFAGTKAFNVVDTSVSSVTLPEGVQSIAQMAFDSCTNITSVTMPETLRNIGAWAFYGTSITSLHIPKNVRVIDAAVAANCTKLKTVTVDDSNEYFCDYDNCIYTKDMKELVFVPSARTGTLTIPEGVERIREQAFKLSKLTTVNLPSTLKRIDAGAFDGASITSIAIPDNVNYIGYLPFNKCKKLTSVTVSEDNKFYTVIDNVIYTKDMESVVACTPTLTSVVVPEGVKSVGYDAFAQSNIKSVTLPSTLISIDSQAFYYCSKLSILTVPSSVTEIGSNAFYGVKKVYYSGPATSTNNWGAAKLIKN